MENYINAIEIQGLTKKYDGFTLDNISFNVPKGSIMGFIGQNGAGKTTTIRALLGIIRYEAGTIHMLGMEHKKHEYEIKEQIAAIFDELPFQELFNAKQIGIMMRGIYRDWNPATFEEYLDRFQLPVRKACGKFSKGMKMKLQIATALSHNAKLLIMDEATTGLDPVIRNECLDIFREYLQDDERSILMSSHITSDLEKIADNITFIDKGKLLLTGYKDDILDNHAIMKCSKSEFASIEKSDFISARISEYGVELLVADKATARKKYSGILMEKTTLEEIMLFYVNAKKKEWS